MSKKTLSYIIITASAVALILLLIFVVPSFSKNEDLFKQHYDNKVAQFESENGYLQNVDIAFIGDSLTEGYDLSKYYTDKVVVNRGIGGDRTGGVIDRLKVSLYDISPKVIVLLIGGNNILAGHQIQTIIDDIETILSNIKQNLPQSEVVVQSLYPMGLVFNQNNNTVKQLNASIKTVAENFSYTYVDMYTPLADIKTGDYKSEYTSDGLHLTESGYNKVTETLLPIIENLLNKEN